MDMAHPVPVEICDFCKKRFAVKSRAFVHLRKIDEINGPVEDDEQDVALHLCNTCQDYYSGSTLVLEGVGAPSD